MFGTPHGGRPFPIVPIGTTVDEVHGLSVFSYRIGLAVFGFPERISRFMQLCVLVLLTK